MQVRAAAKGLDWDDVRFFGEAARLGSATAAAEILGVAHTTVSRRLRGLEARLGTRLFLRRGNRLLLTPDGERLNAAARSMATVLEACMRDTVGRDQGMQGEVRVCVPDGIGTTWLMPRMLPFAARHPGLRLVWQTMSTTYRALVTETDLCVAWRRPVDPDVVGFKLGSVGFSLFAAPAYVARHGLPERLEELSRHKLIHFAGYDTNPGFARWREMTRDFPPAMFAETGVVSLPLIESGGYAALLPDYTPLAVPQMVLQRAPLQTGVRLDLWVCYHGSQRQVERIRAIAAEIRRLARADRGRWFG